MYVRFISRVHIYKSYIMYKIIRYDKKRTKQPIEDINV